MADLKRNLEFRLKKNQIYERKFNENREMRCDFDGFGDIFFMKFFFDLAPCTRQRQDQKRIRGNISRREKTFARRDPHQ